MEEKKIINFKIDLSLSEPVNTNQIENLEEFTKRYGKELKEFDYFVNHDFFSKSRIENDKTARNILSFYTEYENFCDGCEHKNSKEIIDVTQRIKQELEQRNIKHMSNHFFNLYITREYKEHGITKEFCIKLFLDSKPFNMCRVAKILIENKDTNEIEEIEIACYCPKYNILSCCDFTHDDYLEIAYIFVRVIAEELNVKRIIVPEKTFSITIGSDPEFEELYKPYRYSVVETEFSSVCDEIGADGSGKQLEIRPEPAYDPIEHVENIRKIFEKLLDMKKHISVKGDIYSLGCHIHFGVPNKFKTPEIVETCCKLLDIMLGKRLIVLSGEARKRSSYYKLTAFRIQPHGFEYRSLPSAVLLNPEIAKIVFKVAYYSVLKLLTEKEVVVKDPPDFEDYSMICNLTYEEYLKLVNFNREFEKYKGNSILYFWLDIDKNFDISFNDEWDSNVRRRIRERLNNFAKKIKPKKFIILRLYGLAEYRGKVFSGFHPEILLKYFNDHSVIPHPSQEFESTFEEDYIECYFGIPYWIRKFYDKNIVDKLVELLLDEIKTILRNF